MSIQARAQGDDNEKVLLDPYIHLLQIPGKQIRTQFIESLNYWMDVPVEQLSIISSVIEMLHTASLLIDDIEDNSQLRRGQPSAHVIFGIPSTINCANYVYFLALQELLKLNNPKAVEIFTQELICLHKGQGMDLYWRDFCKCPTQEEYVEMVSNKTGGLLRLAVKLMQLFGDHKRDYVKLVDLLGIHFQVRDDLINLTSEEYMKGKGFCEDITEGKFSFPITHSIQNEKGNRLISILKQKTTNRDILEHALECIKKTNSLDYTVKYLVNIEKEAREQIQNFGGNPVLTHILNHLAKGY